MRGIRQWLTSAVVLALGGTGVAQTPAPLPSPLAAPPPVAGALPGGAVVGSSIPIPPAPIATVQVQTPYVAPTGPSGPTSLQTGLVPGGPLIPGPGAPVHGPSCWAPSVQPDCCGPVGAHGPIGQELYFRVGPSAPLGEGIFAKNLDIGCVMQLGGRAQLFEPPGDSAWALDAHIHYAYNNASGQDTSIFRGTPVTIRALHRWAFGAGVGRDWYEHSPGFVAGLWDANFRLGWDVGGRWGTGHVDMNPILEVDGYRRHHDIFAQAYLGLNASMDIPVGGWQCVIGGRLEGSRTFSDFLPGGSFYDVSLLFMFGVKY